uniref:Uncharacterized protein n=1 Tax=Caenorhabditis tropicalis TaxID=1561998 RepID=A0A1I7UYK5_9PELO
MGTQFLPFFCQELNKDILVVKLPCGTIKKFLFSTEAMSFESVSCSDCLPRQMDCDLTPRHTEWCPYTHNSIVFAYNHVLKMNLKYRFDCESGNFQEIECPDCHLNPEKFTDPKQIVLVATSPKSNRAIVLTKNQEGRVHKMQFDENEKKYVDMEPTEIKALTTRNVSQLKREEELPQMMSDLSFTIKRNNISEADLTPLYFEKSKYLTTTDVLVARNKTNGELGMYIFDRYFHLFIQVIVPDVIYRTEEEISSRHRLIFVTQSLKDHNGICIQPSPEKGISKSHYNPKPGVFEVMEEKEIIQRQEEVSELMKKCSREMRSSKNGKKDVVLEQLSQILPFVVIQANGRDLRVDPGVPPPLPSINQDYGGEEYRDSSGSECSTSYDDDDSSDESANDVEFTPTDSLLIR